MDIKKAINWIRHECLSYQLPEDKQKFDNEKGRILDFFEGILYGVDSKEEEGKKMDKWFENLTDGQKANVACNLWDELSFEDKKEEFGAE